MKYLKQANEVLAVMKANVGMDPEEFNNLKELAESLLILAQIEINEAA